MTSLQAYIGQIIKIETYSYMTEFFMLTKQYLLLSCLPFICLPISASEANHTDSIKYLAASYAKNISTIRGLEISLSEINLKCEASFKIADSVFFELDYLLRIKTDYEYIDFTNLFGVVLSESRYNNEAIDCNVINAAHWFETIVENPIEKSLGSIRESEILSDLPRLIKHENFIIDQAQYKLKNYANLPTQEIFDLINALQTGFYRFSLNNFVSNFSKDLNKAVELLRFLSTKREEPSAYFLLGKAIEHKYRDDALEFFRIAAKLEYTEAQIWMGTYYSCHNKQSEANKWLLKAEKANPEEIFDIRLDIKHLGKPSNCLNGWVY